MIVKDEGLIVADGDTKEILQDEKNMDWRSREIYEHVMT